MIRAPLKPAACLLGLLTLAACVQPPRPEAMTPAPAAGPTGAIAPAAAPSLLVRPVTGGAVTRPMDMPMLEDQAFQQALVDGLRQSGLFRDVVTAGAAGWSLRAAIVSQAREGTFRTSVDLIVRYDLADSAGARLWGETVVSRCERGVGDIFDGQARARAVLECAARDNLTDMLGRLRRWLDSRPASPRG